MTHCVLTHLHLLTQYRCYLPKGYPFKPPYVNPGGVVSVVPS